MIGRTATSAGAARKAQHFSPNFNESEREQFLLDHAPKVRYIVSKIAARMPPLVDCEDLHHAGIVGLIDAYEKFDPGKGIKFDTYAEFRIRGAILDELRSLDWISRSARQKANQMEEVYTELEHKYGRPATDAEVMKRLGIGQKEYYDLLKTIKSVSIINLEDLGSRNDDALEQIYRTISDAKTVDVIEVLTLKEILYVVAEAIENIPEKEKLVISLYYNEGLNMKEIGEVLDITESRVSQIHTKAILRLRGRVKRLLDRDVD